MSAGDAWLEFLRRLGDEWADVATAVNMPPHVSARFPRGEEARGVLDWLRRTGGLAALPHALVSAERSDLVRLVEDAIAAEAGATVRPAAPSSETTSAAHDARRYHVLLCSPGDVVTERRVARAYVEKFNRTTGSARRISLQVIECPDPGGSDEETLRQTVRRFRPSLCLIIVMLGQRFGDAAVSEDEVRGVLASSADEAAPEVRFYFRDSENFVAPADPAQLMPAVEQWQRILRLRAEIQAAHSPQMLTYAAPEEFGSVLQRDLEGWLLSDDRPWAAGEDSPPLEPPSVYWPPSGYFESTVRAFESLDISGIDSDKAFKLPLDKVYVRLRVLAGGHAEDSGDDDPTLDIQAALERYVRLVIVGDPGSGKSTFLRFIALTLAQSHLNGDAQRSLDRLALKEPLPVPVFVSCWDLSEHLRKVSRGTLDVVVEFLVERVRETGWGVERANLERLLDEGRCVVLVDGLDEVPTDEGRHLVARLVDELVDRFPDNRYVVTSRIRAYTGQTILGQRFVRCDIQPFGRRERAAFLRNWVDQLFSVHDAGDPAAGRALDEVAALSEAIETSSIRALATNPLLLTVIAIVHWNRKRLPEQRVDLYDECVDVLLGQRKEAEFQRVRRDTRVLDEAYTEERLDQRVWVRKRFAEIAYTILSRSDEEIDREAVLTLLEPHFQDPSPAGAGSARTRAERFLDRQELRSGLLVRRRASSYRFVHLTFQEHLAAWHLASRDLDSTLAEIEPHLRDQTWFEALQLLGGALANRSDEYLDRYIAWLLDRTGDTVREQAPVIALAANILRDTQPVATIGTGTQERFEDALRITFDAFTPESRVPKQTQLELLEALGGLGASVKDQLMSATRARLLDVRRRAVEMLVPHLSDDDLFSLRHVLADRSKEPVKTYINAIVARDRTRAGRLLLDLDLHGEKTTEAIWAAAAAKLPDGDIERWPELVSKLADSRGYLAHHAKRDVALGAIYRWDDVRGETRQLLCRLARIGSAAALQTLVIWWGEDDDVWELVGSLDARAVTRLADDCGQTLYGMPSGAPALTDLLVTSAGVSDEAWRLLTRMVAADSEEAMEAVVDHFRERAETWDLLARPARGGSRAALEILILERGDREETWQLVAALDDDAVIRLAGPPQRDWHEADFAVDVVVDFWTDRAEARTLVRRLADAGSRKALQAVVRRRGASRDAWTLMTKLAAAGSYSALLALTEDHGAGWRHIEYLAASGSLPALRVLLLRGSTRDEIWYLVENLGADAVQRMADTCEAAIDMPADLNLDRSSLPVLMTRRWSGRDETRTLLKRLAAAGSADALGALVDEWDGETDTWDFALRLTGQAIDRIANPRCVAEGTHPAHNSRLIHVLATRAQKRNEPRQLLRSLAAAGSAEALHALTSRGAADEETRRIHLSLARTRTHCLRTLIIHWSGHQETWGLVESLDDAIVERLAEEQNAYVRHPMIPRDREFDFIEVLAGASGAHRAAGNLLTRLATTGTVEALITVLQQRSDHEGTWHMIGGLAGSAVHRMARQETGEGFYAHPNSPRERLGDLTYSLAGRWSHREEARILLARLAAAGSASALHQMVSRWWGHEETQDVVRRLVEDGSPGALRLLLVHAGDRDETRNLVTTLADRATPDKRALYAWVDWALSTGGPLVATEFCGRDWT